MATGIGERLREARRAEGLDLEQVRARTKISPRFLQAMEDEHWDVLPGAAYARAFLHTYAEVLGLDADAIVAEYQREPGIREAQPEAEPAPQLGDRGRRGRPRLGRPAIAALVVALLAGAAVLAVQLGGSDEGGGEPAAREAASRSEQDSRPPADGAPRERDSRAELTLTTTGTVWVCLVDERGQALVEGVTLPAGEKQGPFRADTLELALGNGQVELEANGSRVPIEGPAEPQGYRVTPEGASELDPTQRPTCA